MPKRVVLLIALASGLALSAVGLWHRTIEIQSWSQMYAARQSAGEPPMQGQRFFDFFPIGLLTGTLLLSGGVICVCAMVGLLLLRPNKLPTRDLTNR